MGVTPVDNNEFILAIIVPLPSPLSQRCPLFVLPLLLNLISFVLKTSYPL